MIFKYLIYITLKDGKVTSRGSQAPRATCGVPLEPSGPRDSREPAGARAHSARREKLIFWPQIPTCGVLLEPG